MAKNLTVFFFFFNGGPVMIIPLASGSVTQGTETEKKSVVNLGTRHNGVLEKPWMCRKILRDLAGWHPAEERLRHS